MCYVFTLLLGGGWVGGGLGREITVPMLDILKRGIVNIHKHIRSAVPKHELSVCQ